MNVTKTLPPGIVLCPDLVGRAKYYIIIQTFGAPYYIAATTNVIAMFGLDSHGCARKPRKIRSDYDIEHALRDIVRSLELQLRDSVFAGIERNVTEELLERMRVAMSPMVQGMITSAAGDKLLVEPSTPQ